MLNIAHYERNANQNYNEISPHTGQNGHRQKVYKQYPPLILDVTLRFLIFVEKDKIRAAHLADIIKPLKRAVL